jgi:hypothetical protein
MSSSRRFPPPWTLEEANDACLMIPRQERAGIAYVYFENELGRRAAADLMTKDEAHHFKPC